MTSPSERSDLERLPFPALSGLPPLTCDIPKLQPHQGLAVPVEDFEGEVYADSGPVMLGEELVDVTLDDTRLAHAQLADDQDLEEMFPAFRRSAGAPAASLPASHSHVARLRPPSRFSPSQGSPETDSRGKRQPPAFLPAVLKKLSLSHFCLRREGAPTTDGMGAGEKRRRGGTT